MICSAGMLLLFLYKTKQSVTVTTVFQKILDNSKTKPNKIWTDQGSEFYNNSFKKCYKKMTEKSIQHKMKESVLWLKDLLEL